MKLTSLTLYMVSLSFHAPVISTNTTFHALPLCIGNMNFMLTDYERFHMLKLFLYNSL